VRPGPDHRAAGILDRPERSTAVVTATDDLAQAVLPVAYDRGIRVPGDHLVTGRGDTLGSGTAPPLTSAAVPCDGPGRAGVGRLVDVIAGERRPDDARVDLAPTIPWRRSVAAR
jgi:LacI family transcriptional regulator